MDYADGEFYKFMQTQEYLSKTKDEKTRLFIQVIVYKQHKIVKGIEELHMQQLIHRDLKPENILYFRKQDGILLKICDFGLLKNSADFRKTPNIGTPYYWAPEMISDNQSTFYTTQVDIWALGMILFQMMVGKHMLCLFNTVDSIKNYLKGVTQLQINNNIDSCEQFEDYEKDLLKKKVLIVKNVQTPRITATQLRQEIQWYLDQKQLNDQQNKNQMKIEQFEKRLQFVEQKQNDPSKLQDLKNQLSLKLEHTEEKVLKNQNDSDKQISDILTKFTDFQAQFNQSKQIQDLEKEKVQKLQQDLNRQTQENSDKFIQLQNQILKQQDLMEEKVTKLQNDHQKNISELQKTIQELQDRFNEQKKEQHQVQDLKDYHSLPIVGNPTSQDQNYQFQQIQSQQNTGQVFNLSNPNYVLSLEIGLKPQNGSSDEILTRRYNFFINNEIIQTCDAINTLFQQNQQSSILNITKHGFNSLIQKIQDINQIFNQIKVGQLQENLTIDLQKIQPKDDNLQSVKKQPEEKPQNQYQIQDVQGKVNGTKEKNQESKQPGKGSNNITEQQRGKNDQIPTDRKKNVQTSNNKKNQK